MGGGSYSDFDYHQVQEERTRANKPTFTYHRDVQRGHDDEGRVVERKVHPTLDVYGKVRESCDFEGVPSIAIVFILDVTGSMLEVPPVIQKSLPKAMRLLVDHRYTTEKPQVLFGAVADSRGDAFPLQIGQFEADIRMESNLTSMVLGGGGGGPGSEHSRESYELPLYYLGTRTEIDCWKKRGKKGYAFIFGDEHPYSRLRRQDQEKYMGIHGEDVPIEAVFKAAQEKYNLFFIIPGGTQHAGEEELARHWGELLGEERVTIGEGRHQKSVSPFVIQLSHPELASETTCLIIGLTEGTVPNLEDGLSQLQANPKEKEAIRAALTPYATYLTKR